MSKILFASKPEICVGCKGCEVICSLVHTGKCIPSKARIKVYKNPFKSEIKIKIKSNCDLCGGQPECLKWCPVGVLQLVKAG